MTAVGIVVATMVGGCTGEVVAGSLIVVAVVWPLWPALVARLAEGRWGRLRAEDGELTIVDWRGWPGGSTGPRSGPCTATRWTRARATGG